MVNGLSPLFSKVIFLSSHILIYSMKHSDEISHQMRAYIYIFSIISFILLLSSCKKEIVSKDIYGVWEMQVQTTTEGPQFAKLLLEKEMLLKRLEKKGVFTMKYRMMIDGESVPVRLRAAMVKESGERKLIIAVNQLHEDE